MIPRVILTALTPPPPIPEPPPFAAVQDDKAARARLDDLAVQAGDDWLARQEALNG